ncbi:putative porin [Lacinutrix sp. MedPE-SW]|uniref:putative porin n=1 Tax=Lacinutrix sp. MedPE-SW TaxID=1860087 RepID=UPI00091D3A57|nr:putative porin [Lacinutrix sp. MedPE-SW]OIQ21280.1 MAG: hypothetical protein BM549_09920 [Lacinutrix sp. MedPE-SW]
MNKIILTLFLLLSSTIVTAQVLQPVKKKVKVSDDGLILNDSLSQGSSKSTSNKNIKNKEAKITDYLIISHLRDTTYVDTTQSIIKEYKYNYLRKDNFNLMPFSNLGQTYNTLSYDFKESSLMPKFGARARHFNYMEIDDINYYHVPTPLTELFYKSAFEQGQLLDAFFTTNVSKQLNLSIAYKGLRSLGKYQNLLTSTGNFRSTVSYKTKNSRYVVNAHFVAQDLLNQENGGLTDESVAFFMSGEDEFKNRGVLEVNFENAENILEGKRFYLNQSFNLISKKDSTANNTLSVAHVMNLEDKFYMYDQTREEDEFFGDAYRTTNLKDKVTLEEFSNQLQLNYGNNTLGDIQLNASHTNYNYGYNKIIVLNNQTIPNRLKGDIFAVGGKYQKQLGGFRLQGDLGANVSGDFSGNHITVKTSYNINSDIEISAQINNNSKAPNYNQQLYQSDYINYNWKTNFNNIKTQQLLFNLKSNKLVNLSVDASTINDYVYFKKDETSNTVKPFQSDKSITYLRLKVNKEIGYRNFYLNNTIMYQNVKDDNQVFNVPQIITRNTLYYANHLFKKALYLQTGITFNYFSKYNMDAYDPLLAEFYTQNEQELGGYPRLDFFVNAKIRQTRIFLKAEHFNAAWSGYDYFAAPNNPYRDFSVRFGVVWNFFL